ncbi:MAG: CarD family transcriptional regulator [Alphaproteobacteria bacterium]|nr:CarD family transcriptional regulator [Alphaproteobacteria bacterium]
MKPVAAKPAAKPAPAKEAVKPVAANAAAANTAAAKPVASKPVASKPVAAKAPVKTEARPAAAAASAPAVPAAAIPAATIPAAASPVAAPSVAAKPVAGKPVMTKPVMAKPIAAKPGVPHAGFKTQDFIVYPAHGVGQILSIEQQEVAGFKLELFVIDFVKDKLTLKVPLPKVLQGAIRKLSSNDQVDKALGTLTGRARIKRTMWSRRAQEYEAKINSGDLVTIAEVVRDLYRSEAQPEQSYSERQLYEAALDRMAREVAAVQNLSEPESLKLIESYLQRGPRRGARGDAAVEEAANSDSGNIEEAA